MSPYVPYAEINHDPASSRIIQRAFYQARLKNFGITHTGYRERTMYLITNRALNPEKKGLDVFAKTPSPAGPNELRLMRVTKRNKRWEAKVIIDKLTPASVKALKNKHNLDLDISKPSHASLKVAASYLIRRVGKKSQYCFLSTDITMTSRTSSRQPMKSKNSTR